MSVTQRITIRFTTTIGSSDSEFDVMNPAQLTGGQLCDHSSLLNPAGVRFLLYEHEQELPSVSLCAIVGTLNSEVQMALRQAVCNSSVLVISERPELPEETERVLFFFVEFPPGQDYFLLDGWVGTLSDMKERSLRYLWKNLFRPAPVLSLPKEEEEETESHKLFVLLDLDKTLFLSDADAREEQRHAFIGDFEIAGNMAITNERFQHRMMIRPGCYWFLRKLKEIANVYVITAGDLHYARAAVTHANLKKWRSSLDKGDLTGDEIDVSIPLTNVFSVRNHPKRAAKKTFERVLPFLRDLPVGALCPVLAVDDDPNAWDLYARPNVIPISPFQPLNNSRDHLLNVLTRIEETRRTYFEAVMTAATMATPVVATGAATDAPAATMATPVVATDAATAVTMATPVMAATMATPVVATDAAPAATMDAMVTPAMQHAVFSTDIRVHLRNAAASAAAPAAAAALPLVGNEYVMSLITYDE